MMAGWLPAAWMLALATGPGEATGPVYDVAALDASAAVDTVNARDLVGTWTVDLRPTPDAEPYYQEFVVADVTAESFTGTFYGAPVSEARLNVDWGAVRFAFVTEDGSGPYYHSGVLREGRLEGTTHSPGRGFLAYWTAEKAAPGD
jgi:hypothetical protein